LTTERYFCPNCYAIKKFTVSVNSGTAMCERGCTFKTSQLIKMNVKEDT
jgi:hypothetical protein